MELSKTKLLAAKRAHEEKLKRQAEPAATCLDAPAEPPEVAREEARNDRSDDWDIVDKLASDPSRSDTRGLDDVIVLSVGQHRMFEETPPRDQEEDELRESLSDGKIVERRRTPSRKSGRALPKEGEVQRGEVDFTARPSRRIRLAAGFEEEPKLIDSARERRRNADDTESEGCDPSSPPDDVSGRNVQGVRESDDFGVRANTAEGKRTRNVGLAAKPAPVFQRRSRQPRVKLLPRGVEPPANLQQLLQMVPDFRRLPEKRRGNIASAIKCVGKLAKLPLQQIPTDPPRLRELLAKAHPVQANISAKRFGNVKSELAQVLCMVGVIKDIPDVDSDAWTAFRARAQSPHNNWNLARLARFCTHHRVEPMNVTQKVMDRFEEWLNATLLGKDVKKVIHSTATAYNAIIKQSGLDWKLLNASRGFQYKARPLSTYPASLSEDIDRYVTRVAEPDLFDEYGPSKPLKPITIRNIRAAIRQLADAAVEAGHKPSDFKRLDDLVRIPVLQDASNISKKRSGGKATAILHDWVMLALKIAKYYLKLPDKDLQIIKAARGKLAQELGYDKPAMTMKNRERLGPFHDPRNFERLVLLPKQLIEGANKKKGSRDAAMMAMVAAAIAIELSCPMRAKNLASLECGKHVTRTSSGKGCIFTVFVPKAEVKNRQDLECVIPPDLSAIIDNYLSHHHGALAPSGSTAVFPRPDGRPRDPGKLGETISAYIKKYLGLEVNVHLFRHLAAQQYLGSRPGEYETVRRFLAHAKMDTTSSYYAPFSNRAAYSRYFETTVAPALPIKGAKK